VKGEPLGNPPAAPAQLPAVLPVILLQAQLEFRDELDHISGEQMTDLRLVPLGRVNESKNDSAPSAHPTAAQTTRDVPFIRGTRRPTTGAPG
jgi:hypothetical protein